MVVVVKKPHFHNWIHFLFFSSLFAHLQLSFAVVVVFLFVLVYYCFCLCNLIFSFHSSMLFFIVHLFICCLFSKLNTKISLISTSKLNCKQFPKLNFKVLHINCFHFLNFCSARYQQLEPSKSVPKHCVPLAWDDWGSVLNVWFAVVSYCRVFVIDRFCSHININNLY